MFRTAWDFGLLGMIALALVHCACGSVDAVPLPDTTEEVDAREALGTDNPPDSIDCEGYSARMIACAEEWEKPPELVRMSCNEGCFGRALEAQQEIADCLDSSKDCTEILGCVMY